MNIVILALFFALQTLCFSAEETHLLDISFLNSHAVFELNLRLSKSYIAELEPVIDFDLLHRIPPHITTIAIQEDFLNYDRFKKTFYQNYEPYSARTQLRIPKIIHFIWVGPLPYPEKSKINLELWTKLHPHWSIIVWTDNPLLDIPYEHIEKRLIQDIDLGPLKQFYDLSDNYAEKSDLLRIVLLQKHGGVYIDHDVECYHPFDDLNYNYDFFCGLEMTRSIFKGGPCIHTNNCIIGSKPNHPVLQKTMEYVIDLWPKMMQKWKDEPVIRILATTFYGFHLGVVAGIGEDSNIDIVFPCSFFFSQPLWKNKEFEEKLKAKKIALCNHSFAGTWHGKSKLW